MERFAKLLRGCCDNYALVLLFAAVMYSVSHVSFKVISDTVSVFQVLVVRALVLLPISGLAIHRTNGKLLGEKEIRYLMLWRIFLGGGSFVLLVMATFLLPLVDAAFLCNTYAVFTVLISFLTGMERPTMMSSFGIIGCLVGVTFIAQPPFLFGDDSEEWDLQRVGGVVLAICSQIAMALGLIIISQIGARATVFVHVFAQNLGCFILSVPFLPTGFPKTFDWKPSIEELGLYALVVVCGGAFQFGLSRGFQIGPPARAAIIFLSNALCSAAFGVLVLSESATVFTYIGGGLVLVSVAVVSLDRSKAKQFANEQTKVNELEEELVL